METVDGSARTVVDDGTRKPLEVQCPACRALFVYQPPRRPFRVATPESLFGPPDVRTPPKNHAFRIVVCEHCESEFRPARGTKQPRYCGKSCARRAALARKHGFDRTEVLAGIAQ